MLVPIIDDQHQNDNLLFESYDANQVQKRIEDSDALLDTARGVAHGCVLASSQQIIAQSLYGAGAIGLFPIVATSIPAAIALGTSLNTITVDSNGLSISDVGKFGSGLIKCSILAASTVKVHLDFKNVDNLAKEGVKSLKTQLAHYEGRPQPKQNNDIWVVLAMIVVCGLILLKLRSKK